MAPKTTYELEVQINADEAQLEDADGVLMSAEEAKAFVATLP
jgi:outer membrane biogenesis lipoprotein LolB